jgi:hypothetical protein
MSKIIGRSSTGDPIYQQHAVTIEQMVWERPPEHGFRVREGSGIYGAQCTCGWGLPEQYDRDKITQLAEEHARADA